MPRSAVIMTFLAGALALVSLDARPAASAIVYMGPYEANKTLTQAFSAMKSGDTLIIRDGTYRGTDNVILSTWGGGGPHVPPSGSPQAYTIIRAEHEGQVTFDGEETRTIFDISHGDFQYIEFYGLKWVDSVATAVTFNGGTISHIKFFRCGAKIHDPTDNTSTWSISAGSYILLEECYAWGAGRYGFKVQNLVAGGASKVVVRRCVVRLDDANATSSEGSLPIGGFISYDAPEVEFQNCIVIDSDSSYWKNFSYAQGLFGLRPSAGGTNDLCHDVAFRGCVALNALGWTHGSAEDSYQPTFSLTNEVEGHPNLVENSVGWDVMRAVQFSSDGNPPTDPRPEMRNLTFKMGEDSKAKGISWSNPPIWHVKNSTFINRYTGLWPVLLGVYSDYNAVYTEGADWMTWSVGPGAADYTDLNGTEYNPMTGFPGASPSTVGNGTPAFKYITRIEKGSNLTGTGENGADRGATVVKRYGVDGSLWGDPGYNTLTDKDLWPFPYEAQIRADMRAYSPAGGPDGTRGFCADGQTLTNYIWGYLGNAVPPLGLVATPGGGSVTLSWARPADLALATVTGFNIYRVDGGQRSFVGLVDGNATYTATVTGLDSSSSYTFAMTTVDAQKGESGISDNATATPLDGPGAAPPKTTPLITWATPAPIVQGTTLSGAQLNATANVPGTFVYTPSAGTVLPAGV